MFFADNATGMEEGNMTNSGYVHCHRVLLFLISVIVFYTRKQNFFAFVNILGYFLVIGSFSSLFVNILSAS